MAKARSNGSKSVTYRGYLHIPDVLSAHPDFVSLTPRAIKLLIDIGRQYNGRNNGDLCCSMSLMTERGWKSNDQLTKARRELEKKGWLIQTRVGGLRMGPNLYAISWQPINECGGKLDVNATTSPPRNLAEIKVTAPTYGASSTNIRC